MSAPSLPFVRRVVAAAAVLAACSAADPVAIDATPGAPDAPPVPGTPSASAAFDGIYLGFRQSGVNGRLYQDYWTFLPDGRVVDSDPYEGLARPMDVALMCERFACGTYVRAGGELRIRWADGPERVYDLDAAGAFNERGKTQKYRPLDPITGLRLDATFLERADDAGAVLVRLRLRADGGFEETGLMRYTAWAALAAPGETRSERAGGGGTYAIERNTLALRYDDGLVAYFTVVVPPGEIGKALPDVIYVNTARIQRVP